MCDYIIELVLVHLIIGPLIQDHMRQWAAWHLIMSMRFVVSPELVRNSIGPLDNR